MNYFELTIGERNNKEWRAILNGDFNREHNIVNRINNGEKLTLNQPIPFNLINTHLPEDREQKNPFDLDLIYWTNDLMLDAFSPMKSCCVIVSRKLKDLLCKHSFHEHIFYEVNINHEEENLCQDYFLLQILGNWYEFVNYGESEFVLRERPSRNIIERISQKNTFTDFNSFKEKRSYYLMQKKIFLDYDQVILTVDYDILWGALNLLRINEIVKIDIENSEIKGVNIRPTQTKYVTKSEFEGNI